MAGGGPDGAVAEFGIERVEKGNEAPIKSHDLLLWFVGSIFFHLYTWTFPGRKSSGTGKKSPGARYLKMARYQPGRSLRF